MSYGFREETGTTALERRRTVLCLVILFPREKELEIRVEPRRLIIAGKRETKKEEKKGKAVYAGECSDQILRARELRVEF